MSSAILSGIQRYDIINSITLLVLVVRTILLVWLLSQGYSLLTMGLIFGGSEIIIRLLQLSFSKKLLPQATISLHRIDLKPVAITTGIGSWFMSFSQHDQKRLIMLIIRK